MRKVVLIFSIVLFFICEQTTGLSTWENLSVCLFIYFLLDFLASLGNRIVIPGFVAYHRVAYLPGPAGHFLSCIYD